MRKNEHIEIMSEKFIGESVFSWMEPSQLKIGDELRDDIVRNRGLWHHLSLKGGMMLDHVLPKVGRCVV